MISSRSLTLLSGTMVSNLGARLERFAVTRAPGFGVLNGRYIIQTWILFCIHTSHDMIQKFQPLRSQRFFVDCNSCCTHSCIRFLHIIHSRPRLIASRTSTSSIIRLTHHGKNALRVWGSLLLRPALFASCWEYCQRQPRPWRHRRWSLPPNI